MRRIVIICAWILVLAASHVAAQTDPYVDARSGAVKGSVTFPAGSYINFGSTATGSDGYGLRDSGGTLQFKSTGGVWADLAISHPSGTVSLPGVSFTSDLDTGFYRLGANNIGLAVGGAKVWDVVGTSATFPASFYVNFGTTAGATGYGIRDNAGSLQFKDSGGAWTDFNAGAETNYFTRTGTEIFTATAGDAVVLGSEANKSILLPLGANVLGMRNSTNAQEFDLYTTYTDINNHEYVRLVTAAGKFSILPTTLGTGADDISVDVTPAGTGSFTVATNKFTVAGASGATVAASTVTATAFKSSAAAAAEGMFSATCTGVSPSRVCVLQIYDGGALRTIGSVTY